jgi:hypothetical protein
VLYLFYNVFVDIVFLKAINVLLNESKVINTEGLGQNYAIDG